MAGTDDHGRTDSGRTGVDGASPDGNPPAANEDGPTASEPAPAVSLMITNRQRAALRARGFPDTVIRLMTPAEAHARLGLTGADPSSSG